MTPRNEIIVGDALTVLRRLPDDSVDCVVTSPPYFRLRNYGVDGQLGLERHVDEWVDDVAAVLNEAGRLLRPDGSLWLNLGDTYARATLEGAEPKSLVLAPERLAMRLLAAGWTLRNKVVWAKTNPMPSSIRDRLSCTYEVVYFFVRSRHYYFDLDAIRVPHRSRRTASRSTRRAWAVPPEWRGPAAGSNTGLDRLKAAGIAGHPLGKNPGDVWPLATATYRGAHFATFPTELVRRPIRATCPLRRCSACDTAWRRRSSGQTLGRVAVHAACECRAAAQPGLVLDPFMGAGTVAVVAAQEGRDWLGVELNPVFAAQAMERVRAVQRSAPSGREAAA